MESEQQTTGQNNTKDRLYLDALTQKDLEVFESTTGAQSLFQFCNHTKTDGGEKALQRRMMSPWSSLVKIKQSQLAIFFICEHLELFHQLPTGHIIKRIDLYFKEILPVANHENFIEFSIEALAIWASNERHFFRIVQGVQMCRRLIETLREFTKTPELKGAQGELLPLLDELNTLLDRQNFHKLPKTNANMGIWKTLRVDRTFRVLEVSSFLRILEIIYELDALTSLAETTLKHQLVKPEISKGAMEIKAEGLFHPYLKNGVKNPLQLSQQHRGLFLTGPNMAGKTTYMRAFAIALYFAHLGMGVPASHFSFSPIKKFYSSITLSDNLHEGVSYFRAEAMRIRDIAEAIVSGESVVAIMDEPFKGTNVKDTLEASLAILKRFSLKNNCLFIFSSHQIELSAHLKDSDYPIDFRYFSAIENEQRLRFDYTLRQGVSQQRIGVRVLKEEGVFSLLDKA